MNFVKYHHSLNNSQTNNIILVKIIKEAKHLKYITGFLLIIYAISLMWFMHLGLKRSSSADTHFILVNAKNTKSIENTIKTAVKRYPGYDIYIINQSGEEMKTILRQIEKDFPYIHIIEKAG